MPTATEPTHPLLRRRARAAAQHAARRSLPRAAGAPLGRHHDGRHRPSPPASAARRSTRSSARARSSRRSSCMREADTLPRCRRAGRARAPRRPRRGARRGLRRLPHRRRREPARAHDRRRRGRRGAARAVHHPGQAARRARRRAPHRDHARRLAAGRAAPTPSCSASASCAWRSATPRCPKAPQHDRRLGRHAARPLRRAARRAQSRSQPSRSGSSAAGRARLGLLVLRARGGTR